MVPAGNQAKYNSLVNHTTKKIQHHHHHEYFISSKFVGCESFPELTLLIILLYMKQTWKSQLIDFNHFLGKDYFHLIWKLLLLISMALKLMWMRVFSLLVTKTLEIHIFLFDWLYFVNCFTLLYSLPSTLCTIFMQFHLQQIRQTRFSQSTPLLIHLL